MSKVTFETVDTVASITTFSVAGGIMGAAAGLMVGEATAPNPNAFDAQIQADQAAISDTPIAQAYIGSHASDTELNASIARLDQNVAALRADIGRLQHQQAVAVRQEQTQPIDCTWEGGIIGAVTMAVVSLAVYARHRRNQYMG